MTPQEIKEFTVHVRRVLYLNEITNFTIEWVTQLPIPSQIKSDLKNMLNNHNRFANGARLATSEEKKNVMNEEFKKDKMHNLNLILDYLAADDDIDDVVQWVKSRNTIKGLQQKELSNQAS